MPQQRILLHAVQLCHTIAHDAQLLPLQRYMLLHAVQLLMLYSYCHCVCHSVTCHVVQLPPLCMSQCYYSCIMLCSGGWLGVCHILYRCFTWVDLAYNPHEQHSYAFTICYC